MHLIFTVIYKNARNLESIAEFSEEQSETVQKIIFAGAMTFNSMINQSDMHAIADK